MNYPPPSNQQEVLEPASAVRVLQIVTFAMVCGVGVFGAFALFKNQFGVGGQPDLISWLGLGFAGFAILLHVIVPSVVVRGQLRAMDADAIRECDELGRFRLLFPVFQTAHVVACALLEGAAFFNLFGYFTNVYLWNLVTAACLMALIMIRFPTLQHCEFWVQDRARELESGR